MSDAPRVAMAKVVSRVQPAMKAVGFRKRASSFNRITEPGLVQVVSFQMGRPLPPGIAELPGLRQSLSGLFAVQAGIFVEEAWRLQDGHHRANPVIHGKTWVNDYDCQLRRPFQDPTGQATNGMWSLKSSQAGFEMTELLSTDIFPWLDGLATRATIITALESSPVSSYDIAGLGPDRLLAVYMRLGSGDLARAQKNLNDWGSYCAKQLEAEPHLHGHLDYLAELAKRVGLRPPASDS